MYDLSARDHLEEQILSCLLNYSYLYFNKKYPIKDYHFYNEKHREIYKAIELAASKFQRVDLTTVTQVISDISTNGMTPHEIMSVLVNSLEYSTSEFNELCEQLIEYSTCDKISDIATEISNFKKQDTQDFKAQLSKWQADFSLVNDSFEEAQSDLSNNINETLEIIKKRMNNSSVLTGLDTSIPALNDFTSGFIAPDLILVAGRPGMGKSALCIQISQNLAFKDIPVAFYSYEMPESQLLFRIVANMTMINSKKILKSNNLSAEEYLKVESALRSIEKTPLNLYSKNFVLSELLSNIRYNVKKNGVKLIVVDHVGLITNDLAPKGATEENKLGGISRSLKQLCIELKIPIIALSQLSRAVENRGGMKIPFLADLRQSGSLEQDADIVIFPWRPEYYEIEVQTELGNCRGYCDLIIAKGRAIGTTKIPVHYDVRYNKLIDWGDQEHVYGTT